MILKKGCLLAAVLLILCAAGLGQTVQMEAGYAAFNYPDDWLVLSPQLALVYEPLLREKGINASELSLQLQARHVLSRGYRQDFEQWISVMAWEEENSQRLFDIGNASAAERRQLRSRVENNSLWEISGYKTVDAEWQIIGGRYWLYIHYTRTEGGAAQGRGLRYLTVHNGQYVALDWQIASGRFGNRDLSAFRSRVSDLTFLVDMEEPMRDIDLACELPSETSTGKLLLSGTSSAGAEIILEVEDQLHGRRLAAAASAGQRGGFSLQYTLEEEGEYDLYVTAHLEGMIDRTLEQHLTYNSKTIPVSGIDANLTVTTDSVVISGKTLAGTQLQLVTPFGVSKKRSGNDGSFSFELNTKEEGSYNYTLLLERKGYLQRRVAFTVVRVVTVDQQKDEVRKSAVKISYRDLQKGLESNRGKVLNLYGPVTEVSEGGGQTYLRLQFNKDSGGKWYNPVIIVCDSDPGVRAGSFISAVATVEGIYVEQADDGSDVNVPQLKLLFIDRIE